MTSNLKSMSTYEFLGLRLKNRFVVAPMTRVGASEEGLLTEKMEQYYTRFAQGDFALIVTEGMFIDEEYSKCYRNQPGICNEAQALSFKSLVDKVHEENAFIFAQLMHAGALSQYNPYRKNNIAPSVFKPKGVQMKSYYGEGEYPEPQEATRAELENIITQFVKSAKNATEISKFDGVEIHAANGYLLDQFITDYSNFRTDEFGGSIENRIGFILDIVRAVKKEITKKPVGIRISQGKINDFFHKWPEKEHAAKIIFSSLESENIDYIHVTEFEAWQPAFEENEFSLIELARKYAPNTPLLVNGSLHEIDKVENILRVADMVSLGRGALANPDFPKKIKNDIELNEFDLNYLMPIADIKEQELNYKIFTD